MFPDRYFPNRFFAPRYFASVGLGIAAPIPDYIVISAQAWATAQVTEAWAIATVTGEAWAAHTPTGETWGPQDTN